MPSASSSNLVGKLYGHLSDDQDRNADQDISAEAHDSVPGNFLKQLFAGALTKIGDALSKPGLVLTWLLTTLGTPAAAIGMLVPVREAGSLLPQMIVGGTIRRSSIRKGFWIFGCVLQGAAVLGMAFVALKLEGAAAGWTVVGLLALFSLARGICSIVSKDLLGRTIPKTRRGRLSGLASSVAGYVAVAVGIYFTVKQQDEISTGLFAGLLGVAGTAWLLAAMIMSRLDEKPAATSCGDNAFAEALKSLRLLRDDPRFLRFCVARALLASTVLSMPFYVVHAHQASAGRLASLGFLMISGSLATALSAAIWGKLADRSSRLTLAFAGLAAGAIGCLTAGIANVNFSPQAALWVYGVLFFLIGLAHTGIRLGRKTYLVDMATADNRASLVAVSNTLIGIVLLISGSFGLLADALGERMVILLFAVLGLVGGAMAFTLPEVQGEG